MKIQLFFLLIGLAILGCNKNKNYPVPYIPTDMTININLPSYSALQGVGGYATVVGGSKGIIVYRSSINTFVAFDLHSPADNGQCVDPLENNADNFLQLDDQCVDAAFSLLDGSPLHGSEFGLRAYQTYFNGSESLRIYN